LFPVKPHFSKKEQAMPIKYKTFEAQVKAFDDENLILEHFISTEHKDRDGDVMRAKGMKIVGKPVVLLLHGRGSMGSEPVGKPLSITVDEFKGEPGILAKTQFFPDDVGRRLYGKAKGGFLPNWSIGYKVDEAKDLLREGKYDGRDVTKWQLFEYSPVGVPANPFAQTIKEFLDKVEKGEKIPAEEARWFGFPDPKECKDCGQGCEKHGEEKPFANEHSCRVKDPGQFPKKRRENNKFGEGIHAIWGIKDDKAHLQAIRFSADKFTADAAKKWAEDHKHTCILFEPATGKEEQYPEAEPELLAKIAKQDPNFRVVDEGADPGKQILEIEVKIAGLQEGISKIEKAIRKAEETIAKYKPLLEALPPEPDGGTEGDAGKDNPPGQEEIPLLVFQPVDKSEEARKKAEREQAVAAVAKAIAPIFKTQIDKIMGRVP
jgi:hypothetical protein